MKFNSKKGFIGSIIILIVLLVVGLIAFVLFMPTAVPFIDSVSTNESYSPMTRFLFAGIPFFTLIAIIVGLVLR